MSARRQTMRDLMEEAKKRVVLLLILVFGLSYLMSLTSSSVWVNLPAATSLIIFCRYISLDFDVRRRSLGCDKSSLVDQSSRKSSVELLKFPLEKPNWRLKVNSPAVEKAIEQFTRHLVSEWVTDLWYARITPDRDGPEELVQIMNDVLGEISRRARDINLINLLTRDIIHLICNHLELYRSCQAKLGHKELGKLPLGSRDVQLRLVLAAENRLHPALFSLKAEHKVLQRLMNGLISLTFKPEDLQCSFFKYTVRELLACAVFRPVLNLANPRVINEKIETLVHSFTNKAKRVAIPAEGPAIIKPSALPKTSSVQFSGLQDHSTVGVELMQLKHDPSRTALNEMKSRSPNGICDQTNYSGINSSENHLQNLVSEGDKLLPPKLDVTSSDDHLSNDKNVIRPHTSGGEWAQMLDVISRRKTQALAPEQFENMWTKGRYYNKKEGDNQVPEQTVHNTFQGITSTSQAVSSKKGIQDNTVKFDMSKRSTSEHEDQYKRENFHFLIDGNGFSDHSIALYQEKDECYDQEEVDPDSESSYQTDDDESRNVTGLDSPGIRIWDSKNKRNASISCIWHPLETFEFHGTRKSDKGHVRHPRASRTSSGRKRSKSSNLKVPVWQEVDRTSFLSGDGQDILNASKGDEKTEELSDEPEVEVWGRIQSGATATSSVSISASESRDSSAKFHENSVLADSFLKLRCEVLGASVVKSGSGTFAVYSITVVDANNNRWSIKRRFRHFEELHRRLKEFPEYNLSLPPKHFLSSGLDMTLIEERCKLLDKYLKNLLQLPNISGSIEVWDFLSVDSQTYMFSDSLSIIETLSVNLEDKSYEKSTKTHNGVRNVNGQLNSSRECLNSVNKEPMLMDKNYPAPVSSGLKKRNMDQSLGMSGRNNGGTLYAENVGSESEIKFQKNVSSPSKSDKPMRALMSISDSLPSQILEADNDSTFPTEWVPPNLSVPILDLVDVIFQLQDGGWIRRQAFWVAKQILQLGMGDAFDDWLIKKIQLLRKGSVIASAIKRVEQILWPDGIFLTKHPNRKPRTPIASPGEEAGQKDNMNENLLTNEQQQEAARQAQFVHELIVEKGPAALVSLVGRKEYKRCAQDIYFFLQSPVCLKQFVFELLELLLLAAFPELDDVVRQCHEDKEQFGVVEDAR